MLVGGKSTAGVVSDVRLLDIWVPASTDDLRRIGFPWAATIEEVGAIISGGTSVVLDVVKRARTAPFSGGSSLLSSAYTATTTWGTATLIGTPTVAANDVVVVDLGTVTGTVPFLLVWIKYKKGT